MSNNAVTEVGEFFTSWETYRKVLENNYITLRTCKKIAHNQNLSNSKRWAKKCIHPTMKLAQ